MFKHLLVPVDSSSSSGQAVQKALGLAQACGSTVTAIYVVDPYAFSGVGADFSYGQAEYLEAASLEAEQALKATRAVFERQGVTIATSLVEGHAVYRGILETAAAVGADLIVMGSHGRRGLEKLLLGSVTSQVLSHTHLPVLVIRD
ncbi:MAG: universal stress protein [Polaromonas sp.]|nr:universal stress protein [Polaromonas sp.]